MTAEKKKYLVRAVVNSETGPTKVSSTVMAHNPDDAREFFLQHMHAVATVYSVAQMTDVEEVQQEALQPQEPQPQSFAEKLTTIVPWFGKYDGRT